MSSAAFAILSGININILIFNARSRLLFIYNIKYFHQLRAMHCIVANTKYWYSYY